MRFRIAREFTEVDLGLTQHPRCSTLAVNYYHKALHLGCCSSPRSASGLSAMVVASSALLWMF